MRLYQSYFRPLICPECRAEINVDFVEGIERLPLDFKLSKLVDLVRFMKTKDGNGSSSSDEADASRRAHAVSPKPPLVQISSADAASSQTTQSSSAVADISSSSSSALTTQTHQRGAVSQLSLTTGQHSAGVLEIVSASSPAGDIAPVETEPAPTAVLGPNPAPQQTPSSVSAQQTIAPSFTGDRGDGDDVGDGGIDGVDAAIRFGGFLSPGESGSCPSGLTPSDPNPIHFSLSSLPGNLAAGPAHQPTKAEPGGASNSALRPQQRACGDGFNNSRASSLPPLEALVTGTHRDSHSVSQPAPAPSLSSLPGARPGSRDAIQSSRQTEQAEVAAGGIRHRKTSGSEKPPAKVRTPRSGLRWRNLLGSGSSSSSSWSGSDPDSDSDPRGAGRVAGACESGQGATAASDKALRVSSASTDFADRARTSQKSETPVAGSSGNKKRSKRWLMTRFLRSIVFSDSSSTYSEDSDEDGGDDEISREKRANDGEGCMRSSTADPGRGDKRAQTSSSLPNIAATLSDHLTSPSGVRASNTSDNIGGSLAAGGVSNSGTYHQSKLGKAASQHSAAAKPDCVTSTTCAGHVALQRPSVSSQTEVKQVDASPTALCLPTASSSEPDVRTRASQTLVLKTPSASFQTNLKDSYTAPNKTERTTQHGAHLPLGEDSPRTLYDNVSPNRHRAQPFHFELPSCEGREGGNPGAIHSAYDNYNSAANESRADVNPAVHSRYDNYISGTSQDRTGLNPSRFHQIDTLKEDSVGGRSRAASSLPLDRDERPSSGAGHNLTVYDNVRAEDVQRGVGPAQPISLVRAAPGTEIEDLKTGWEHRYHHHHHPIHHLLYQQQQQQHQQQQAQEFGAAQMMEGADSASLVSSVEEPSLLTSDTRSQEVLPQHTQHAQHLAELCLADPAQCSNLGSGYSACVESDSAGPDASMYDNRNPSVMQSAARIEGNTRDQQASRFDHNNSDLTQGAHVTDGNTSKPRDLPGACGVSERGDPTALNPGRSEHTVQAEAEESGDKWRVCNSVYVSHRPDSACVPELPPHVNVSGSGGDQNLAPGSRGGARTSHLGAVVTSSDTPVQAENNNNDCKSAHGASPKRERNNDDDADVEDEDDDDEENAHSSSAMLKTKKKKPRSKFTKFLTSLLSLSSSSDDEDYVREAAEDSATTSSKSSDW
ncbi:hypothetical protein EGW08_018846 [Elysia chlorotica]|uniref:Uncharacterized protein n=1 Tax=Elysia chlorotica TaxID=188477 RepID=A0A3S0Z8W5_ELYCH|nr:hypothetical protein EGW08_018846 [Elysia chlorotica]